MDTTKPEQGPTQPERANESQSQSQLDPEVLVQNLADHAEALIPEEGDSASALEKVAEALRQGSDPANLDRALTALEQQREWSPATRELALEISQLDQRERSEMPLSFADAVDKLRSLGRSDIDMILLDLDSMDDQEQVDAIDNLLEIVEDLMGSFPEAAVDKTELLDYRAIRNSLLLQQEELKIAIEQAESEAFEAFQDEEGEDEAKANVAKVYNKAQPGSNDPDRGGVQQFDDQAMLAKVPEDPEGLMWYENQNFHLKQRTRAQVPFLRAFVSRRMLLASEEIPTGGYSGSVTDIMGAKGEALDFFRLVASTKLRGQLIPSNEFSRMSFADVARTIGLNVYKVVPDYDQRFPTRR